MTVTGAVCPSCGDVVWSRALHDFRSCSCKETSIDGGLCYLKITYRTTMPNTVQVKVDVSKDAAYQDWNRRLDKLGLLRKGRRYKLQRVL